ncbi:MAG TPA: hypothetical protein VFG69_21720 [Nannocystaceae bacterium]|nr:hypothetical protein [Nannocystaceae bacterium]
MKTTRWWWLLLVLASCDSTDAGAGDDYIDEDLPAGNCMTGTGCATEDGGSSDAPEGTCESTLQCDDGQRCVATFDGDIGEFECRTACIEDMDETRWCVDDEACCSAVAVCSPRGYCVPPEYGTSDDGTGSTDGGSEGSGGSGESTGSSG